MEVFERLNALASADDLSDLYMGTAPKQEVSAVLRDLSDAVDTLLDPSSTVDLAGAVMSTFLEFSLPVLVELLLRRKSHWYGLGHGPFHPLFCCATRWKSLCCLFPASFSSTFIAMFTDQWKCVLSFFHLNWKTGTKKPLSLPSS